MNRSIFAAALLSCALVPATYAQDLPEGKGKDIVNDVCSACHGVDLLTAMRSTKEGWGYIVDDMVSRGAQGSGEQIATIKEYLAKNFGQVNPSKAPSAEIASVLEITAAQADAIVKYRTANGAFKTVDDLKKVPGLDAADLDKKKDRLVF